MIERRTVVSLAAAVTVSLTTALHSQGKSPSLANLETRARADSNDPVAHYNVAVVLFDKHRYEDAERSLRQAIAIDAHYAPALLLLSRTLFQRAYPRGGYMMPFASGRRIVFLRVGASNTDSIREVKGEAVQLRRRGFLLDPLLELGSPGREWLPVRWAGTLSKALHDYEHGQWASAAAGFQTVIDRTLRPTDSTDVPPVALWYRARTAIHTNDYETAIHDLRWLARLRAPDSTSRVLEWNPFVGEELQYILAYVHQQAGRSDEAIALYQEVLSRNLSLDIAHSHLADIYETQQRWPEAVQERRRAIDANPDDPGLMFELGSTLAYAGQYEEAEQVLTRFAETHSRESRAYYLLGFTAMRLHKPQAAREALARYLALAPSRYADQIADARRRLDALAQQ